MGGEWGKEEGVNLVLLSFKVTVNYKKNNNYKCYHNRAKLQPYQKSITFWPDLTHARKKFTQTLFMTSCVFESLSVPREE